MTDRRHFTVRVRHVVYFHVLILVATVFVGRSELWGYAGVLQTGVWSDLFAPVFLAVVLSPWVLPAAVWFLANSERPREQRAWAALPLSVLLSGVQFLALLPLVQ